MSKRRGPQQKQDQQMPQAAVAAVPAPEVQATRSAQPQASRSGVQVVRQPSQYPMGTASGAANASGVAAGAPPAPDTVATPATTGAASGAETTRQATPKGHSQPPLKKVKTEPPASPTPARSQRTARSVPAPQATPQGTEQPAATPGRRSPNTEQAPKRPRAGNAAANAAGASTRSGNKNIAWVLSTVRHELDSIIEVEGVRDQLDQFPVCVMLGSITARREFVAALMGQHQHASAAAAALVAPGMRQPIMLELRHSPETIDLGRSGPEADHWLASVSQAAAQALGKGLKVDALRLRLSCVGVLNLDVVDLPERGATASPGMLSKVEEMRIRYLGGTSNLLVCLEPGPSLDLCRRFDPSSQRTVLLGAAAPNASTGDAPPASELCGLAAARGLEERFVVLCQERCPKWLAGLERLEMKLSKAQYEAAEVAQNGSTHEVLRRARAAGVSFGRALQHVVSGTPGCESGALTLEEELQEFAASAAEGACGTEGLSGRCAAAAAAEVWSKFPDGMQGYIAYLKKEVGIASADVPLNGGAAWQRLLEEIDVAMRLAQPPEEEFQSLLLGAIQAGGTGIHGHQRWDDVASKLLLTIAFDPLLRRVHYVAARVAWAMRQQKTAVADWMATLETGPSARLYSNIFSQHVSLLRSSPITRELVFGAFDKAAAHVADLLLKNLEGTLSAGCLNPQIMLRPHTEPELNPRAETAAPKAGQNSSRERGRDTKDRQRVKAEMQKRHGESSGLPTQLRDRIFAAKDAEKALPHVEQELRRAFSRLQFILANQSSAFAETTLSALCQRHVDEAMDKIDFSTEQRQVMTLRESELQTSAKQALDRVEKVRKCVDGLRTARAAA